MQTYVSPVTPIGEGGISVLHLIGPQALPIIRQVFKAKSTRQKSFPTYDPDRLYLGYVYEPGSQKVIDEVIIHYITLEQSLTGLATVEINAHGGTMASQKIINCLQSVDAQLIPREKIIKLAPKNRNPALPVGRLDLTQQEAMEYLIKAPTHLASLVYLAQYQGRLSEKITQVIKSLEGIALTKGDSIRPLRHSATSAVNTLLASATLGLTLSYPRRIVITGRANVGKSTLFNALFKKERVITHHLPGTTRDAVEETIALDGIPFKLIDTAGLGRKTKGIERLAQSISHTKLKQAELVIAVLDGSQALHGSDLRLLKGFPKKKTLVVINKTDLPQQIEQEKLNRYISGHYQVITISALKGIGIDILKKRIMTEFLLELTTLSKETLGNQPVVFTRRQYNLLKQAQKILEEITDLPRRQAGSDTPRSKKSGLRKVKTLLARVIHH